MEATLPVISDVGTRYLRLHLTPDIGPIRVRNLVEHFGSVDAVLGASIAELERVDRIGPVSAQAIFAARNGDDVEQEVDRAASCGIRILCWEDADYPAILRNITDPPICLYVRGRIEPADGVAVAIVGTRRCSTYGREQALRFGELLGRAGFTVVSGLARGVDGHAHRGALQTGGRTIAVLGNGLATIYPPEHRELADQIAQAGAVVSEFPMDSRPDAANFPRRNRIITGLSLGVIVIEAGKASGSLITARLAAEYNREVFALPGQVDRPEQTAGVNSLIRDGGAKLITCLDDVLDELGSVGDIMGGKQPAKPRPKDDAQAGSPESLPFEAPQVPVLTGDDRTVFDAVSNGAENVDAICLATGLDSGRVMATLTNLQLKSLIRQLPGHLFEIRSTRDASRR